MFSKAKVGDRVWSVNNGWGVITDVEVDHHYPIEVLQDSTRDTELFTKDGKLYHEDSFPVLFWDEVEITPPAKPLPELAVDTPVLVRDEGVVLYHCPTCDSAYPQEHSARYCCKLKTSQIHRCSDCGRNYPNHEAADICCRSTSKTSKVDVKTVLYAAFDLLNSHREMSENEYTIVGSNSLDDIGGLLQDYIEQNEITGFLEL